MIFSLWPMFLTDVLGASRTAVGLIDGLGDAVVSISQAVSGYVSDRIRKRKVFVWIGYFLGGIAKVGYAFAPVWGWVIPFRILDRSGKMRGAPRDAIVSDLSTVHDRGRHFGILRTMDNSGAVVGIIASLVLVSVLPLRTIMLCASIPSLIAVIIIILAYREKPATGANLFHGFSFRELSPRFRLYLFLSSVFALGSFSYSFLLLAAREHGWSGGSLPALYLLSTAIAAVLSLHFGGLADRIGRKPVLLFSLGCWMGVCILFITTRSTAGVITAFILYGLHNASLDPVQKTLAAELAPSEMIGTALGGFQMVIGIMSLPASLIAGMLLDRIGFAAPFAVSMVLAVVAGILLLFVRSTSKQSTEMRPA